MTLPSKMLDGYKAFKSSTYPQQAALLEDVGTNGQTPETMIISCCDSRALPEQIFNALPGQLFVVRNVANLVPPYAPDGGHHSTSAALEFAVNGLGVQNIIVMGHGRCGGIAASLERNHAPLAKGDFIGKWMSLIKEPAQDVSGYAHLSAAERQTAMERISVRNSVENLRTFPYILEGEKAGNLTLGGAWFDIAKGELWVMDIVTGEFSPA